MIAKQDLVAGLIADRLKSTKNGLLIRGMTDVDPLVIGQDLLKDPPVIDKVYVAAAGRKFVSSDPRLVISDKIEDAVRWRSDPDCAGRILVFIQNDTDKLHSLAEFDTVSSGDAAKHLLQIQIDGSSNQPVRNFWTALQRISDYYQLDTLYEFAEAVERSSRPEDTIPECMWMLSLLSDPEILSSSINADKRLLENQELIIKIGQLSVNSRQRLSRAVSATEDADQKKELLGAYQDLQSYYKYGEKEILRSLKFQTVKELFSTAQKTGKGKTGGKGKTTEDPPPIKPAELNMLVAAAVVEGDEQEIRDTENLLKSLEEYYASDEDQKSKTVGSVGGLYENREIAPPVHSSGAVQAVGRFCSETAWGGILNTEESSLNDALSTDFIDIKCFNPADPESCISYSYTDSSEALFSFLQKFEEQFEAKKFKDTEKFGPVIQRLTESRKSLADSLDLIINNPVLLFSISQEKQKVLIDYIESWEQLYHALSVNEPRMREISPGGTVYASKAVLSLEMLYVKTPSEWKALMLPLHPMYLWRYYEVMKTLTVRRMSLSEEDRNALKEVLADLPQILNYVIVNSVVTGSSDEKVLPCSGTVDFLPAFQNRTNRYLGADGTEAVQQVLTRWMAFAPYTRHEIRICSVDAPDLLSILRQIRDFMKDADCGHVVYYAFFTRGQNANSELARLDYGGTDHEIGELIKQGRLSIRIINSRSPGEVKQELAEKPVHIAFYFDQSSYSIQYGPASRNLYINPLVVTYQYEYDQIENRGKMSPSSDMTSGLIGDYHKVMKNVNLISSTGEPRTVYNGSTVLTDIVTTVRDGQTQWLVAVDRETSWYQPPEAIPIGEKQYGRRMVGIWASSRSRIIDQYMQLLRNYSLYPQPEILTDIVCRFGHIASAGLVSIPASGADSQSSESKRKGLLGTLFAAAWYERQHDRALVVSLDNDQARVWLQGSRFGNERADLLGLYYDSEKSVLHIQPIEVKTRDDFSDARVVRNAITGKDELKGHPAEQIEAVMELLRQIFQSGDSAVDMFAVARREVLKFQVVSECFRAVHDSRFQLYWYDVFQQIFPTDTDTESKHEAAIEISGVLLHIQLSRNTGGRHVECQSPGGQFPVEYWTLTASDIRNTVLAGPEGSSAAGSGGSKTASAGSGRTAEEAGSRGGERTAGRQKTEPPDETGSGAGAGGSGSRKEPPENTATAYVSATEGRGAAAAAAPRNPAVPELQKENVRQIVNDFKRACSDYSIELRECRPEEAVVGPSVVRLRFRLARGMKIEVLRSRLDDIAREMRSTRLIVQDEPFSGFVLLDIPRRRRDDVLFSDIRSKFGPVPSPEQLPIPIGRTPDGQDLIADLGMLPHMLVGGSTGSGKTVFLFCLLSSLLLSHPDPKDLSLILSSSKYEDFVHFEGLPHLYSGSVITDAREAARIISEAVSEESDKRGRILAAARKANIIEYNKTAAEKLKPIVVVIDEFADLADQLEDRKDQDAFYKPVQRIAQTGRSRGIHLIVCTQRPEARLVPTNIRAQLNGRVALKVNDGPSSKMIIETTDAQNLQSHGDLLYKGENGAALARAQGYLIRIPELDEIIDQIKGFHP